MASYEAIYQHLVSRYSGDDVYAFFQRHERDVIRRLQNDPVLTTSPAWLSVTLPLPVGRHDTPASVRAETAAWVVRFPDVAFKLTTFTDPVRYPHGQHELTFTGPEGNVTMLVMEVVLRSTRLEDVELSLIIKDTLMLLRQVGVNVAPPDPTPTPTPTPDPEPDVPRRLTDDPILHDPFLVDVINDPTSDPTSDPSS